MRTLHAVYRIYEERGPTEVDSERESKQPMQLAHIDDNDNDDNNIVDDKKF